MQILADNPTLRALAGRPLVTSSCSTGKVGQPSEGMAWAQIRSLERANQLANRGTVSGLLDSDRGNR